MDIYGSCIHPSPSSNMSSNTGFHHFPAKIFFGLIRNHVFFAIVCSSLLKAIFFPLFFWSLIQYCLSSAETEHLKSYTIKMMDSSVRACRIAGSLLTALSYLFVCSEQIMAKRATKNPSLVHKTEILSEEAPTFKR